MVSRATWRGFLKLSLVSCAVSLYPASQPSRIVAKTINRKTGNTVRRVYVDAVTNEVVGGTDQGKGFVAPPPPLPEEPPVAAPSAMAQGMTARRVVSAQPTPSEIRGAPARQKPDPAPSPVPVPSPEPLPSPTPVPSPVPGRRAPEAGALVEVASDELRALDAENTHTIEIEQFVARGEVDWRYLDTPYYIGPGDRTAAEAFSVIRATMQDDDVAGIGNIVLARRERPILIVPCGNGLVGILLRFADEVRGAESIFAGATQDVPEEMQELAHIIIERKTGPFDPERFQNRHRQAVADLIRSKQVDLPEAGAAAPASNVVSIMDALRRSISADAGPAAAPAKTRPARSVKRSGKK